MTHAAVAHPKDIQVTTPLGAISLAVPGVNHIVVDDFGVNMGTYIVVGIMNLYRQTDGSFSILNEDFNTFDQAAVANVHLIDTTRDGRIVPPATRRRIIEVFTEAVNKWAVENQQVFEAAEAAERQIQYQRLLAERQELVKQLEAVDREIVAMWRAGVQRGIS